MLIKINSVFTSKKGNLVLTGAMEGAKKEVRLIVTPSGIGFGVNEEVANAAAYLVRRMQNPKVLNPAPSLSTSCGKCTYCKVHVEDDIDLPSRSITTIREDGFFVARHECRLLDEWVDDLPIQRINKLLQYSASPLGASNVWLQKGNDWVTAQSMLEGELRMRAQWCPYFRWQNGNKHQLPQNAQFPIYVLVGNDWHEMKDGTELLAAKAAYVKCLFEGVEYRILLKEGVLKHLSEILAKVKVSDLKWSEPAVKPAGPQFAETADKAIVVFAKDLAKKVRTTVDVQEIISLNDLWLDLAQMVPNAPSLVLFMKEAYKYGLLMALYHEGAVWMLGGCPDPDVISSLTSKLLALDVDVPNILDRQWYDTVADPHTVFEVTDALLTDLIEQQAAVANKAWKHAMEMLKKGVGPKPTPPSNPSSPKLAAPKASVAVRTTCAVASQPLNMPATSNAVAEHIVCRVCGKHPSESNGWAFNVHMRGFGLNEDQAAKELPSYDPKTNTILCLRCQHKQQEEAAQKLHGKAKEHAVRAMFATCRICGRSAADLGVDLNDASVDFDGQYSFLCKECRDNGLEY